MALCKTACASPGKCHMENHTPPSTRNQLRLLSYNMQLGIRSRHYGDYLAKSWRHLLPPVHPTQHLEPIAQRIRHHDIVALQEADSGSFRTRSLNLVRFLAERAEYPYWKLHNHRQLAGLARHAMGILSQLPLLEFRHHKLPGRVPGRTALHCELSTYHEGGAGEPVQLIVTHLALGESDRRHQLSYLHEVLGDSRLIVLMGDLNCETDELRRHPFFREREFLHHPEITPTFPSWQPKKILDHILVSPDLKIVGGGTVDFPWSDHLPVALSVELPPGLSFSE